MKLAWEWRARRNPMHYVADGQPGWDPDQFFATGRDDVDKWLRESEWGDTSGASLLEIGCGLGRMTRHLAPRFARVTGVDISAEMIRRARELNAHVPNAEFRVVSGVDLREFPDASFDFAMSYIVMQHMPSAEVVLACVGEALRVLKPGGTLRFQARNDFIFARPDTYDGASVSVDAVRALAKERGRELRRVEGEGTHYCYFTVS